MVCAVCHNIVGYAVCFLFYASAVFVYGIPILGSETGNIQNIFQIAFPVW